MTMPFHKHTNENGTTATASNHPRRQAMMTKLISKIPALKVQAGPYPQSGAIPPIEAVTCVGVLERPANTTQNCGVSGTSHDKQSRECSGTDNSASHGRRIRRRYRVRQPAPK